MNEQNNDSPPQDILPSSQNVGQVPSVGAGVQQGILETIEDGGPKKYPSEMTSTPVSQVLETVETIASPQGRDVGLDSPEEDVSTPPLPSDERFPRLLAEDRVYQSMIRSEDIKNIRLQLSMRYMLLMLAIFVVIAWVVNNRVIMFGFYDFPVLSRIRDGLFGFLTGLFCLTVWFGSSVWMSHRAGVLILRGLAIGIFIAVIVSIYLPFWR